MNEQCEVCQKKPYTKLCDHATGTGINSSGNRFREFTVTCDKKMCDDCAVYLWADCDLCPDHANEVYASIRSQAAARKEVVNR
jgi:hypothetical protein